MEEEGFTTVPKLTQKEAVEFPEYTVVQNTKLAFGSEYFE